VSDRFYFDGPLSPGDVTLEGPEAHHLANVRRFQCGDTITLFNGDGSEYPARILSVAKKQVLLQVTEIQSPRRELPFAVHVAATMPKGDRGDFLIEKLTELGATSFTPLITERSVVKIDDSKTDKLRRAVIEASKQCGRNMLMQIHGPARWAEWFPWQTGRRLIAHPGEPTNRKWQLDTVTLAIGPEGGFTEDEVASALVSGWERMTLGPRILRVETAALAAVALAGQM
jgi:16S rRNA (uracil1498-N3)-methyltransferase